MPGRCALGGCFDGALIDTETSFQRHLLAGDSCHPWVCTSLRSGCLFAGG